MTGVGDSVIGSQGVQTMSTTRVPPAISSPTGNEGSQTQNSPPPRAIPELSKQSPIATMGNVFGVLPRIEYPVTEEFESMLFNQLTYVVSLLCLAILTVINVAVVGYDQTIVLSSDFNATQSFWYHAIIKAPEPGTLCEPHVFNVGDTLVTNASVFEWKILAITRPNAGKSGVAYSGTTLDSCDVAQMSFYGDLRTWSLEIVAYSACRGSDDLEVIAYTSFSLSPLPGRRGILPRNVKVAQADQALGDLLITATDDMGFRAWDAFMRSNRTGAVAFSLLIFPSLHYPNSLDPGRHDNSPINNILHLALAAIRIDLGNPSPNNFLTHPESLNQTLTATFPETPFTSQTQSLLYTTLNEKHFVKESLDSDDLPIFSVPGPSTVQAVYVCKFMKRKKTGNLIITVFVATVSMFTSGWAVFILIARYFED
ncbi:hypothetical protein D9611_001496 [Ephemerocybe angulata]|uniref:Uncharacterized protein n=1 Tax=Ephemerocybe angulata TaxID=980116 RepID=A0A8H5FM66_9AGAR|nr:hypothetical protein D9611_001496 [Tulosesus angulatus]